MFWQFENWSASQIDKVLDKEDASLTELLNEDDVIQECKSQNQKLLQYLTQPQVMEELVDLIVIEPAADVDEKIRFKHSNLACELLTSDLDLINDALLEPKLLNKLYNFIETENQLNPLLASFFSKTMSLLSIKRTAALFKFLQTKENFVQSVLYHIQTSAIMDFLLKLVTVEDADTRSEIVKWLSGKELVPYLIAMFSKDTQKERQVNAAQFLCDIVKVAREQQSLLQEKALPNQLLEEIESSKAVSNIVDLMFETRSESSIVQGIHVLQSLIEYKRHNANINQPAPTAVPAAAAAASSEFEGMPQPLFGKSEPPDQVSALDACRLAKCVCQVHEAVTSRLTLFCAVLVDPPPKPSIPTTVGVIEKPLGAARLEVAHFIRALLSSNNPAINQSLLDSHTVTLLVDLFFEYQWNSFLHTQVEQSIRLIFQNTKTSSPVTSPDVECVEARDAAISLARELLLQTKLIQRLVHAWYTNTGSDGNTGQPRPGYMGHLIRIANHVVEASAQEAVIKIMADLPEDVRVTWDNFVKSSLAEVITRLQTPLVAEAPSAGYGESHQHESALHQAFIEYQMQQMTRNLCTQIGFNTSEFSDLDDAPIQSRADQLSKINFDLEAQMKKISEEGLFDAGEGLKDENSSDEDDLWDEKPASSNKAVVDMEIDVQDPWLTSRLTSREKRDIVEEKRNNDVWANFESFGDESAAEKPDPGEESAVTENRKSNETVADAVSCKSHSAETGSGTAAGECEAEKS